MKFTLRYMNGHSSSEIYSEKFSSSEQSPFPKINYINYCLAHFGPNSIEDLWDTMEASLVTFLINHIQDKDGRMEVEVAMTGLQLINES